MSLLWDRSDKFIWLSSFTDSQVDSYTTTLCKFLLKLLVDFLCVFPPCFLTVIISCSPLNITFSICNRNMLIKSLQCLTKTKLRFMWRSWNQQRRHMMAHEDERQMHVLLCKHVGKYMDNIKKVISLINSLVLYVLVSFLFHVITDINTCLIGVLS